MIGVFTKAVAIQPFLSALVSVHRASPAGATMSLPACNVRERPFSQGTSLDASFTRYPSVENPAMAVWGVFATGIRRSPPTLRAHTSFSGANRFLNDSVSARRRPWQVDLFLWGRALQTTESREYRGSRNFFHFLDQFVDGKIDSFPGIALILVFYSRDRGTTNKGNIKSSIASEWLTHQPPESVILPEPSQAFA